MFCRFIKLVRQCGPVTFELQHGLIILRGSRRIFGGVSVSGTGLGGHLNLTREVKDRRIRKAEPLTKSVVFHKYEVSSMAGLDDEFASWLCEARSVGDGSYRTK